MPQLVWGGRWASFAQTTFAEGFYFWHLFTFLLEIYASVTFGQSYQQSYTQSPQASWSVGGHRQRLWGNGIVLAGILWLTVLTVVLTAVLTVNSPGTANQKNLSR